jgi:hypothetical protein
MYIIKPVNLIFDKLIDHSKFIFEKVYTTAKTHSFQNKTLKNVFHTFDDFFLL